MGISSTGKSQVKKHQSMCVHLLNINMYRHYITLETKSCIRPVCVSCSVQMLTMCMYSGLWNFVMFTI